MKHDTEERILASGTALLQEKGLNGFSFADIAAEVGIRKASIHYYFPSKLDLVHKIMSVYQEHFFTALKDLSSREKDMTARLEGFVALYRSNLTDCKMCPCSMLSTEAAFLDDELKASVASFFQRSMDWLQQVMSDGGLEKADEKAKLFFAAVQGAQIVTRECGDLAYFDSVADSAVRSLQK